MARLLLRSAIRRTASAAVAVLAGCGGATGPGRAVTYELRAYNGRPVSTQAGPSSPGVTLGIVGGSLRFPAGTRGSGSVVVSATIRTGGPGVPARDETRTVDARYARRGDLIAVAFPDAGSETFVVEAGGRRLRTVASRCGGPCTEVLNVSEYEQAAGAN